MLVRLANREVPDQTASSEVVRSGSVLFVFAFLAGNVSKILELLPYGTGINQGSNKRKLMMA